MGEVHEPAMHKKPIAQSIAAAQGRPWPPSPHFPFTQPFDRHMLLRLQVVPVPAAKKRKNNPANQADPEDARRRWGRSWRPGSSGEAGWSVRLGR